MALQAQQIVTLACKAAKCPGFTADAGTLLNVVLADLARLHDFEINRKVYNFSAGTYSGLNPVNHLPYWTLPADYLRAIRDGVVYSIDGVPITLIQKETADFDQLITTSGFTDQPVYFTIDDSASPPNLYLWPPPNAAYPFTMKYYGLPADITNPQSSTAIPWYPLQGTLIDMLSARLMKLTDDTRQTQFEAAAKQDNGEFLTQQRDLESTVKTVRLDRNTFRTGVANLKNTKRAGF